MCQQGLHFPERPSSESSTCYTPSRERGLCSLHLLITSEKSFVLCLPKSSLYDRYQKLGSWRKALFKTQTLFHSGEDKNLSLAHGLSLHERSPAPSPQMPLLCAHQEPQVSILNVSSFLIGIYWLRSACPPWAASVSTLPQVVSRSLGLQWGKGPSVQASP